jgi:phytoene synthase
VRRDGALAQSYARCRAIARRHGTTYYWATAILPREVRPHVHAIYAFCRYADDVVDARPEETAAARGARLAAFGDRFFHDLAAGSSSDPILAAVVASVQALGLDPGLFRRFLRSMRMDLERDRYATYADLLDYMDGSAAVIGEMMLPALSAPPEAREAARSLGLAFQLTNFLRDVGEDLDRGRVYLPWEDVEGAGAGADLLERRPSPRVVELLRFEIERARRLYAEADLGIPLLSPTPRRCVLAARRLYAGILERIERNDYDVFATRARVPTLVKLAVAGRMLVGPLPADSSEVAASSAATRRRSRSGTTGASMP